MAVMLDAGVFWYMFSESSSTVMEDSELACFIHSCSWGVGVIGTTPDEGAMLSSGVSVSVAGAGSFLLGGGG
jgi:hypothetical protein